MKGLLTLVVGAGLVAGAAAQEPAQPVPAAPAPQARPEQPAQPEHAAPAMPAHQHGQVGFVPGGSNDWFPELRKHLGTYFDQEEAVGAFEFRNPRDEAHKLQRFQPSCQCTKVVIRVGGRAYEIGADKVLNRIVTEDGLERREEVSHVSVEPGQKGEIEVHMKMGYPGDKDAQLSFEIDDEELPACELKWRATGAVYFTVVPPDVHLNEMSWTDQREFEFTITSPLRDDFNLVSHDELSPAMQVEYEKEMRDGKAIWHVKGTYGPGVREQDGGGVIRFNTDVDDKTVEAHVTAFVTGPLTVKPGGFIALGRIDSEQGKEVEVKFEPAGDFDLQVEKLSFERLDVKGRGGAASPEDAIKVRHYKDGKDVVVVIAVEKGIAKAYVTGTLRVYLNHPAAPYKDVMFNGLVN